MKEAMNDELYHTFLVPLGNEWDHIERLCGYPLPQVNSPKGFERGEVLLWADFDPRADWWD